MHSLNAVSHRPGVVSFCKYFPSYCHIVWRVICAYHRSSNSYNIVCILAKNNNYINMLTIAIVCRSYPFPGSIVMIAFLQASRFCASFGSSWCCLKSLCTLSIHLSLGLPRGLFSPTFIVVTSFTTFLLSLLIKYTLCFRYVQL